MKSLFRRTGIIMLLFVFFISACLAVPCEVQAASKKPSLSRKTVTIRKGNTKTIKVRNAKKRVKWKSTNKKVAVVKKTKGKKHQKAIIKAKRKGTCYIKAKIGKKTLKCKVTVKKKKVTVEPAFPIEDEDGLDDRKIETKKLSSSSVDKASGMSYSPPAYSKPDADYIKGVSNFSFNLFRKTVKSENSANNVLISPDSIMTALIMTENGADNNTLAEMETVLGGGSSIPCAKMNKNLSAMNNRLMKSDGFIYNVSNSIWARENLVLPKKSFLETNKKYHDAEYFVAPFNSETVSDMNKWVYNKSRNMIDKIIDNLSEDSRMVLINTIAFEGKWADPFSEMTDSAGRPVKMDFKAKDKTVQKAVKLCDTSGYEYFKVNGGQAFAKYYRMGKNGERIAFVGILPPENVDIDTYVESLTGQKFISGWNSRKNTQIALTMPAFSYDYSTEMSDTLKDLGIREAFTNDADFTKMADPTFETPGLKISKVLHKTHIEVFAKGTKAAAATAVVMEKASAMPMDPIKLTLDRPFVYALVDADTGIPLFIGEVASVK